jgi:hypothetical protein
MRLAAALPLLFGVACDDAAKTKPAKEEPAKADAKIVPEVKFADDEGEAKADDEGEAKAEGDAAEGEAAEGEAKAEGAAEGDAKAEGEAAEGDAKAEGGITSPEGDAKVDEELEAIPKPKYGAPRPHTTQYGTPAERPQATKYGGPPRPAMKYGAPPKPSDDGL